MPITTLSKPAQKIINDYLSLPFAAGGVQCPYYNNDRLKLRGGLRVLIGKGSPRDILEEALIISLHDKIDLAKLAPADIKKFLVDHRIGVDCSGFVYYALDAELKARGKKNLAHYLFFPEAKNLWRKILVKLRPVENTGVATLTHIRNSRVTALVDAQPGDFITMQNPSNSSYVAHVVLISAVEYKNDSPAVLHYTHSIPWVADGRYNHGVRPGTITLTDLTQNLASQTWTENNQSGPENETYTGRVQKATEVSLRRLNALVQTTG